MEWNNFSKKDSERRVVFLDIDGVLQPCYSDIRHEFTKSELKQLQQNIAGKYKDERYLEFDIYDTAAVYLDWDKTAVGNLQSLLDDTGAEIVVSSDWRNCRTIEQLRLFFQIHGLEKYVTEFVPYEYFPCKEKDIQIYLTQHPALKSYVVVDDHNMQEYFGGRFLYTGMEDYLSTELARKARRILEFGLWYEEPYICMAEDCIVHNKAVKDHFKKVIFCDVDGVLNMKRASGEWDWGYDPIRGLIKVVKETAAEVILFSSWRQKCLQYLQSGISLDEQLDFLLKRMSNIGIASIIPLVYSNEECVSGIKAWLQCRPEVKDFVVLCRKEKYEWECLSSRVVQIEEACNLDNNHVEEMIKILGNKEFHRRQDKKTFSNDLQLML